MVAGWRSGAGFSKMSCEVISTLLSISESAASASWTLRELPCRRASALVPHSDTACGSAVNLRITLLTDSMALVVVIALRMAGERTSPRCPTTSNAWSGICRPKLEQNHQERPRLRNLLQVGDDLIAILVHDILECGAHQVHDAQLNLRQRVGCVGAARETRQTINARNENVFEAPILQVRSDMASPQNFAPSVSPRQSPKVPCDPSYSHQGHESFVLGDTRPLGRAAYVHYDAIEIDNRPDRVGCLVHMLSPLGRDRQ